MISIGKIKGLVKLFEESDVCELEVKYFGGKVRIEHSSKSNPRITDEKERKNVINFPPKILIEELKLEYVCSPGIGTFYWNEQKENYHPIVEGEKIIKGQIMGYVEAMNFIGEIKSDYDGLVKKVLVKSGDVIDFKQALFEIEVK
jgi:acetyl-CoA carboxylase biotin carboxyl carrier protein